MSEPTLEPSGERLPLRPEDVDWLLADLRDTGRLVPFIDEMIVQLCERAARLWVYAHPDDADHLRQENTTTANRFLSFAENAAKRAVHR